MGELFARAWKVYIDIEKREVDMTFIGTHRPNSTLNVPDMDLLRPGRIAFKSDAMTQHRAYNSRARAIMEDASSGADQSKATMMEAVRIEFRKKFFEDHQLNSDGMNWCLCRTKKVQILPSIRPVLGIAPHTPPRPMARLAPFRG